MTGVQTCTLPILDIAAWLDGLGLGQYEQAFRENEIDERVLPSLTAEDLNGNPPCSIFVEWGVTGRRDCP